MHANAGHNVLLAEGGGRHEVYDQHAQDIAATLPDLIMPDMDGCDVFHELKQRVARAKIILCSGHSMNGQAGDLISMGVHGFL